jgi:hypothetical protein
MTFDALRTLIFASVTPRQRYSVGRATPHPIPDQSSTILAGGHSKKPRRLELIYCATRTRIHLVAEVLFGQKVFV